MGDAGRVSCASGFVPSTWWMMTTHAFGRFWEFS